MDVVVKKLEDAITAAASDIELALNDVETHQAAIDKKLDAIIESLKDRPGQRGCCRGAKHRDNLCVHCGDPQPCSCACGG